MIPVELGEGYCSLRIFVAAHFVEDIYVIKVPSDPMLRGYLVLPVFYLFFQAVYSIS